MRKALQLTLALATAAAAAAVEVRLVWFPPAQGVVESYNLYQISDDGSLRVRVNQQGILEPAYALDVGPGDRFTVRAFNGLGEGPESEIYQIPFDLPGAPTSLTSRFVTLEESFDLISWRAAASFPVQDTQQRGFYRLVWH